MKLYNKIFKRILDVIASAGGLVLLSPVYGAIALTLLLQRNGESIIISQERPGLNGVPFKIYKFRSMRDEYDEEGHLLPDEARTSGPGSILRRSGLDELPQLWNVLKGEMSIVGPRPLLQRDFDIEPGRSYDLRHSVRPGLTGWVQVNGRNSIPWNEKFRLDDWYVRNQSFLLDTKIVLLTFRPAWLGFLGSKKKNNP